MLALPPIGNENTEETDIDAIDISVGTREDKRWGVNVFDSSPKNLMIDTFNSNVQSVLNASIKSN